MSHIWVAQVEDATRLVDRFHFHMLNVLSEEICLLQPMLDTSARYEPPRSIVPSSHDAQQKQSEWP